MHLPKLTLAVTATALLFFQNIGAYASTFTFTDDYIAFPGYPSYTPWGNGVDEYGNPQIKSMVVTLDSTNTLLQKVTLNLDPNHTGIIRWDNLFINTSYVALPEPGSTNSTWDQSWDYLVHTGGETTNSFSSASNKIWGDVWTKNGLYSIKAPPQGGYSGFYTTVTGTRWDGTTYSSSEAVGHPDGIDQDFVNPNEITGKTTKDKTTYITGKQSGSQIVYDFTSLTIGSIPGGIPIIDGFTIAYTPWCANDVFLASAPVPEPATLLLFGSGIVGLAGLRLRRKAQAN